MSCRGEPVERGRVLVGDLFWHGIQVFVASLLVTTGAGEYISKISSLSFWQEATGSVIVAVVSQLFNYISIRGARRELERYEGRRRRTGPEG